MTGKKCLSPERTAQRLAKTEERTKASKERREKLNTEFALSRNLRSPLLDFVDDLVHRPPNTEQMRQLKELLLQEQQSIAQLITLIDRYLDSDR
ncbi:hypothetical protein [Microseira wollei]|uniref:BHLH domain-containing protein n=1 Tax=Microseira wollei NIES-4236 TaxID=2530354 RepID=A0AAV3XBJ8_9CYAN|nr:hypothetical protein [Microseira wollei]GET38781.1 hypothetical protein MiSe_35400 [Microseira wollei NIES-4236]